MGSDHQIYEITVNGVPDADTVVQKARSLHKFAQVMYFQASG